MNEVATITNRAITTPMAGGQYSAILSKFVREQDVKESSRRLYIRTLRLFFEWVATSGRSLNTLDKADIVAYKDELIARHLSNLSVSSYLTSIRKFYEWSEAAKLYPNITKGIKTPKRKNTFVKQHLNEEMSSDLLNHFQALSLRDYAIVNLILRTGLRTIEVVRADVGDITFRGGKRVLLVWGKGHDYKDDFVVLTDKAYEPIRQYLATRPKAKAGEPLFVSQSHRNSGGRLTTRTISALCKDGLKSIGLDSREYTAHSLRHTTAVAILKHGGALTDAQHVLRHNSPTTTQIYVESVKEEMRLQAAPETLIDDAF